MPKRCPNFVSTHLLTKTPPLSLANQTQKYFGRPRIHSCTSLKPDCVSHINRPYVFHIEKSKPNVMNFISFKKLSIDRYEVRVTFVTPLSVNWVQREIKNRALLSHTHLKQKSMVFLASNFRPLCCMRQQKKKSKFDYLDQTFKHSNIYS